MDCYCLLFADYDALDLMGPVEMLQHAGASLHYVSQHGGLVRSRAGFEVMTTALTTLPAQALLLVPGGQGTRALVQDAHFLQALRQWLAQAHTVLSVCTGAALLAATGALDGLRATSNKKAFAWVQGCGPQVLWQPRARWVQAGKFHTSSGVSAGMDMALAFIAGRCGLEEARRIARHCEYLWSESPQDDPFAAAL
ncbi:dimethyladenosine transferase [Vandammella animalimorsus]|uniref:Dimethyladenosine transferase n=1 Tax=Vandammella animalimorsus TaxID=2029117 RepID=A0A2A2AMZ0_9BURK|nr:DJ-1/PfpI family protein [Vandammella animalimorsus]PAT39137.1 dimethyladenosine transferase [Vandammella animalimorsus]